MAVFEASPEGFRAQNLGRPPAHLVRELIQNVLDEAATMCRVEVKHTPKKGCLVRVSDDVPGGIRDESLVFTIWASDKQDSPTKRGRMGRGLKELVSVSDWTTVSTVGRPTIEFSRAGAGDWKRKTTTTIASPIVGTVVEAQVKSWSQKDARDIVAYLAHIRPPRNIRLYVNDQEITRKPPLESYALTLPSVTYVIEDGERRVSQRSFDTTVDLFSEEKSWAYEMGLPIEEIDFPFSIDVAQRVPLREQRDTLINSYRNELYAKIVSERIGQLPPESLKDSYILKAADQPYYLSDEAKRIIADAWTEGKPFANTPQMMSIATGQHIGAVNLRVLPEAIRYLVEKVGVNVRDVIRARAVENCPQANVTSDEARLIDAWQWIADGIGRPCAVIIAEGRPSCSASFDQENARLTVYREQVGADFFEAPLKVRQLGLLIHELSHWKRLEDSHGLDFHSDAEHVGAAVAVWLMENYHTANLKGGGR